MNVKVKNVTLGEGIPKICVPLVSQTKEDLLLSASSLDPHICDLAEWRADWLDPIFDEGCMEELFPKLKEALGPLPLLFTFRTQAEGGHREASTDDYLALTEKAIRIGHPDLVDIELFSGEMAVRELISIAHEEGVKVILSNHEFYSTPPTRELLNRLYLMETLGADIAKIAVTPKTPQDVLSLLYATYESKAYLSCPVITMSMKGTGLISRLGGEIFGSCLTFGSAGQASAPGQIDAAELKSVLNIIHKNL